MKMRYFESGTLTLDENTCIGCGRCVEVCPHNVFTLSDKKAHISDLSACMECGACMKNCPVSAAKVAIGTGCAQAIIKGKKSGNVECGCSSNSCC